MLSAVFQLWTGNHFRRTRRSHFCAKQVSFETFISEMSDWPCQPGK
jgi:hypothetical protein